MHGGLAKARCKVQGRFWRFNKFSGRFRGGLTMRFPGVRLQQVWRRPILEGLVQARCKVQAMVPEVPGWSVPQARCKIQGKVSGWHGAALESGSARAWWKVKQNSAGSGVSGSSSYPRFRFGLGFWCKALEVLEVSGSSGAALR